MSGMEHYSFEEFVKRFPDDDACLEYVSSLRLDKCECGRSSWSRVKGRKSYACACGKHISPLKDTIFAGSKLPLRKWFYAIYLFSQAKNGVSAAELQRHLGCTYKTAWKVAASIRSLMEPESSKLTGEFEADETYVGGRPRYPYFGHSGRGTKKTPVFGIVRRSGDVRAHVVENVRESTLKPLIRSYAAPESTLYTDEFVVYDRMGKWYYHDRVKHGDKEFVKDYIHTNTIEGFWSIVKNNLRGTYKGVSHKHLQSYLNQFAWMYNHRHEVSVFPHLLALCLK